jgi:hypothetical protein
MRRLHRGDLSAPVLAIIVTIGVIAAGLVLMAWFWWFAPRAGKTGVLTIIGQPALVCTYDSSSKKYVVSSALISVKNAGSEDVTISKVVILGTEFTPDSGSVTVKAGDSASIKATPPSGTPLDCPTDPAVTGTILTSAGTYVTSFAVVSK